MRIGEFQTIIHVKKRGILLIRLIELMIQKHNSVLYMFIKQFSRLPVWSHATNMTIEKINDVNTTMTDCIILIRKKFIRNVFNRMM